MALFELTLKSANRLAFVLFFSFPISFFPELKVLGHLKTMLILVLGYFAFKYHVDSRNIAGTVIAMVGVVSYTEVKRRGAKPATNKLPR